MPNQVSSPQNYSRTRKNSVAQPCTTPTARTPSMGSYCWEAEGSRRRSSSLASRQSDSDGFGDYREMDMDTEDERMVEHLLEPSPTATQHLTRPFPASMSLQRRPSATFSPQSTSYEPSSYSQSSSLFTTTDPFYLATVQHLHQPATQSFFAQSARPAHNSPFLSKSSVSSQSSRSVSAMSMDVDPRPVLVSPAGPGMGMYSD